MDLRLDRPNRLRPIGKLGRNMRSGDTHVPDINQFTANCESVVPNETVSATAGTIGLRCLKDSARGVYATLTRGNDATDPEFQRFPASLLLPQTTANKGLRPLSIHRKSGHWTGSCDVNES